MRVARVMELSELLREADTSTVAALAKRLKVSRRTVLRDLATLRESGLTITGEAGPGGGVRLERDRGLLSVHLSLAEAVGLWLGATLGQQGTQLPWGNAATRALSKVIAALPPERAKALKELCRRVIVGPTANANMRAEAGKAPDELLHVFEESFSGGKGLGFAYRDGEGRLTQRKVEPHGLLVVAPVWYLIALDLEKNESRMFRMDRISRPRLLPGVDFRPDFAFVRARFSDLSRWRPLYGHW
ncbi:MAG: WYL domain-containing protein [Myxococcaceae bacterium]